MNLLLASAIGAGLRRKLACAYTGENWLKSQRLLMCVISGILKLRQLGRGLMGKVKQHNLRRHSNSLKPLKMVKKMTPDVKKSRRVDGLKEKLIKKRPKPAKKVVKKKKARWTSDAPVICEWCKKSFSR